MGSFRRMLWGAFAGLVVLIVVGLALNLSVLNIERRETSEVVRITGPLISCVNDMNEATLSVVSSSRGYAMTGQSEFQQQYEDAIRAFDRAADDANEIAKDAEDKKNLADFREHFNRVRQLTGQQMEQTRAGHTAEAARITQQVAELRRAAPDFAGKIEDDHRRQQSAGFLDLGTQRQWLVLLMVVASILIVIGAGLAVTRIEGSLSGSINKQVRRTEAMIAGMADGVMLVDGDGRTVFINPAGQALLGKNETGVPITKHVDVYRLRDMNGKPMDPKELPASRALSTGRPVKETTMFIARDDRQIAISMTATPLHEDNRISGVVVTFRDVTERQRLEGEMQLQAERNKTLADAGAFFASNIDPVWVTQAIAERVAEVMGDWAAVILRSSDSNELRVAAIYHREMASLGLAWSYIYRQPLVVGDGIIGQVVATGYPSLTTNIGRAGSTDPGTYHTAAMKLASLLILPLRTRREMLGALIIAADDPERAMTDEKLPLAEVLAERAALAIENAKLYTEQVDARRKVEDLSRLKDEFLSIASHELRTPVTSIKGYTQLAKTLIRENDLATSEEYLDIALDQIDRMSRLILELLDVSRIETGRLEIRREPIQWSTFVRDVVHRHHTAVSDRRFHLDVSDGAKTVNGDRDRLEQVLGNLLENAVKYSPDGSEIFVGVDDRSNEVVTSVCDRGIGIPADELSQVFERFHRGRHVSSTNYGGLGLGLYITKQIIERHGGSIWVESREGAGTTFYFSLPTVTEPSTPALPPAQAAALT
ncbi:MAG: GAF domain-containing protein [Acidobacteria bacterium]|nr:GAF domain-containing protein [Acidobacteriota bacterium]